MCTKTWPKSSKAHNNDQVRQSISTLSLGSASLLLETYHKERRQSEEKV